ncbi:MAG: hypothetical protein ABSG35_04690 [Syntrophobacteraceae bacterium]
MDIELTASKDLQPPERFGHIKKALQSEPVRLCSERALLITEFFKFAHSCKALI